MDHFPIRIFGDASCHGVGFVDLLFADDALLIADTDRSPPFFAADAAAGKNKCHQLTALQNINALFIQLFQRTVQDFGSRIHIVDLAFDDHTAGGHTCFTDHIDRVIRHFADQDIGL